MTTAEASPRVPTEDEVVGYVEQLSNWGRWGPDDQLGTLNFVTPEVRQRAAGVVRDGVTVSLAMEMRTVPPHLGPVQRFMMLTGQGLGEEDRLPGLFRGARMSAHTEFVAFAFHGPHITHLDAFSHISWDRKLYNGAPAAHVTSWDGATTGAVTAMADGIFTRGVLVDVPRLRGVEWLEESEGVFPEDLEAAEAELGFTIGEGDAVILRTGYRRRVAVHGEMEHVKKPGWHAACMPWFHARNVALIGTDVACDVGPSGYRSIAVPVHVIALRAMGMPILDECDLEPVAEAAARLGRWEFLLTMAPLRLQGGTGSPVNPVAVF